MLAVSAKSGVNLPSPRKHPKIEKNVATKCKSENSQKEWRSKTNQRPEEAKQDPKVKTTTFAATLDLPGMIRGDEGVHEREGGDAS